MRGKWVFFYRKDTSFDWNNIEDLKKATIGITLGEWVMDGNDEFTKALRGGELTYSSVPRDELNFLMMNAGRIDVFPQQLDVGYEQLNKLVADKRLSEEEAARITHHPKPFRTMPLYLLLSKKHERNNEMIELFNKGLQRLKESGRYQQIIDEYRRDRPNK